jgi:hypothetical protein
MAMNTFIFQAKDDGVDNNKRVLMACVFALFTAVVYAIRRIDQILNSQLWAEDGPVFLQDQILIGFDAILRPYAGYLHLLPRLTAFAVDKLVSLEYVPVAYVAGALLVATLSSFAVALTRLPWPAGPLFAFSAVMVPHGGEVFLNVTNMQWMVAPLLMAIAVQDDPQNRFAIAIDSMIVVVVGLTGPFILFTAPFIVARLQWHSRSRYNISLAVIAVMIAAVQISVILNSSQTGVDQGISIEMLPNIIRNFWFGLFFGFITQAPLSLKWLLMAFTFSMALALWLLFPRRMKIITIMFSIVSIMIFAAAIKKLGAISEFIQPTVNGQRYFYIPYVLTTWIFILGILQARKPGKWIAIAMTLMIVGSAARAFQAPPLPDMEWRRQVASVGAEPMQIPINPPGWFVTVHRQ